MTLDFNEIRQLLVTIAQTDIAEVTLKNNEFELTVRKAVSFSNNAQGTVSGVVNAGVTQLVSTALPGSMSEGGITNKVVDNSVAQPTHSPLPINQKLVEVPSPMVGTFYRSPAPGEAAFVEVGDRVKAGQSVCIIEAMKLMNEIEAEVSGQVMEILLQNGEPVEYGQPLMRINPD
ncbi:acetyl-CoA carboxylase biotin carboxyl carrier protein [Dolichospermum sp. ST_con]|nr:acetyl-CoA carboxylase biotin carboxyl carrier protein [Dolichospermum sp. ST_con]MDD1418207.1 acetyl-CoA carboxylase biotin carboxyl carrier protein [Dolichospermum sp. ST_sed1]MDD1424017.1 acetyl-CoA carboxylase biotin carboxyl carrier protein [Dolichospermum sp. ST_sed9]MDD1430453.1 acetyl-CoA carboxylase biotin carboxyl carrier protein [Dolichospermum sp. ST_sed6]MDD1439809.1 acetyl-CoA carboxylase biotin carboxyl carrier protein [Dolichospermum sp. ST_sed3]MDD1446770.1 acetyl-CoA carbo